MEKKKLRNSSTGEPQQSQTVMIIEDDQALSKLLHRNLRRLGLGVEIALTGADAIDRVAGGRFDLALLDYRLPDMTGISVIETLAEQKHTIPFIVTTGLGDEKIAVELMKLGARDYLVKDATFLDRLPQAVERVLQELDTERRLAEAEETLRESEERFHVAASSTSDCIWEWNIEKASLDWFGDIDSLLGYPQGKFPRTIDAWANIIHPEDHDRVMALLDKHILDQTPYDVTYRVTKKDGSIAFWADRGTALLDKDGKAYKMIGTVKDITESTKMEEALRESEEYFKEITENSSDIIIVTDKDGIITYCSPSIQRFTGYKPEEIMGRSGFEFIHPDDIPRAIVDFGKAILTKDTAIPNAFRILHKDGSVRFFDGLGKNLLDHPSIEGFIMNIRDDTDRWEAENALRETAEKLQTIFDSTTEGLIVVDLSGNVLEVNEATLRITGYSKENLIGKSALNFVATRDRDRAAKLMAKAAEGSIFINRIQLPMLTADGTELDGEFSIAMLHDASGNATGYIGAMRDITEQKRAQEALRASEEKYRDLVENINDVLYTIDTDGTFTYISPAVESLIGYTPAEIIGQNFAGYIHPDDLRTAAESHQRVLSGESTIGEYRVIAKSGAIHWIRASNRPIYEGELVIGTRGILTDITEQKLAQETIQRRLGYEQLLSRISSLAVDAEDLQQFQDTCIAAMGQTMAVSRAYLFEHHPETDTMVNTQEWCAEGILPQKQGLQGIPVSNAPWWVETLRKGQNICFRDIEDIPDEGAKEILRPQGVRSILVVPLFVGGHYHGFIGFDECRQHRDWPTEDVDLLLAISRIISSVTERKLAEEAIRENEEKLRLIFASMVDGVIVTDMEGEIISMNDALCSITRHSKDELLDKDAFELVSYVDRERLVKDSLEMIKEGTSEQGIEYKFKKADGELFDCELRPALLRDASGKPVGIITIIRDITERKLADEALRESERRLKEAQALGRIGNWEFDVDRGTIEWSDEVYKLYERDPSLGPPTPEEEATYYSEEQAAILREYVRRAMETGEELEYDLQAKLPGGRIASFSASMHPIRDESGRVVKLFGTVQDITERKLAEMEREHLIHDLDERVRELNCLYGISTVLAHKYDTPEQLFNDILEAIVSAFQHPDSVCARIFSEGTEYRTGNFRETPWKLSSDIRVRGEPVGTVEVYYTEEMSAGDEGPFLKEEWDLINAVSDRLGGAIERKRARDALRESEERYRGLIEMAPDVIYTLATDGTISSLNPAFDKVTGWSRDEWIGKSFAGIVHPDDLLGAMQSFEISLRGEHPPPYEMRIQSKSGDYIFGEFTSSPILAGGQVIGELGIARDITERKRAEQALAVSEERYRSLFDEAPISVSVIDLTGKVIDCNQSTEELTGYDRAQIIGKRLDELMTLDARDKPELAQQFKKIMSGGKVEPFDLEIIRRDGERRWIRVRSSLLKTGDEAIGIQVYAADITDSKLADVILRESEERYRDLFEGSIDGVFVIDAETMKIALCNRRAAQIYRFDSPEQTIGLDPLDFVPASDREQVRRIMIEDMFLKDLRQANEFRTLTKDGEEKWISAVGAVIDYQGKPAGLVSFRDVTVEKQTQKAFQEMERKLQIAFASIDDGIVITDLTGTIIEVNEATARLHGYDSKEQMIGLKGLDLITSESRAGAIEAIMQALGEGRSASLEYKILRRDGSTAEGEGKVTVLRDANGEPIGMAVITRDITDRKRVQEEIKRNAERTGALYAVAQAVSQSLDLSEMLNSAIRKVCDVMGTERGYIYLLDMERQELVLEAHVGMSREYQEQFSTIKLTDSEFQSVLHKLTSEDQWEALSGYTKIESSKGLKRRFIDNPIVIKGEVRGIIAVSTDSRRDFDYDDRSLLSATSSEIAVGIENAELMQRTRELSVTDELTGVYNRRHFYDELETEMHRMRRYGKCFSIAMLDLDGFKEYNDQFGHTSGDAVLRSIAQILKSSLRKSDTVFRYGGDEFAVIFPGTESDRAAAVLDRVRGKWLKTPISKQFSQERPIGFSAGIAQFPDNSETSDGLIFLADAALYHAKRTSANQTITVSHLDTLSAEVLSMATRDQVYALAATVDARDPYTYGHSSRVATITEAVAREAGITARKLANVYAAALLHDIGKLGVPDAILTKPGRLDRDEYEIIKKHPVEGARIVGYVKELSVLIPMIRHHHEWYDGSGYPDGLKGEEIPLEARIISIADAYDTMTTKRLYREVVTREEAIEELRRCAGTQFDPELVEVFCRTVSKAPA